jgi:hypothetical protein
MLKKIHSFILTFVMGCLLLTNGLAQENVKLAQSGFQFLSVVSDARAAAMGEAMTSLQIGSSAMFFNPAGMADMTGIVDASASINQWIADIRHNSASLAVKPFDGDYGVLGLSLQYVDYGDFYGTRVNPFADQGYDDTGIFSLSAMAFGVGYAKQLTDRFSIGGQVRFVHQDLGESTTAVNIQTFYAGTDSAYRISDTAQVSNDLNPLVFDFGTQFKTGLKSLVFGMSVRNFSAEYKYGEEAMQAPLTFTLGISMDVMDLAGELPFDQSLYVSVDASHHRDHPEQVKLGLDYRLMDMISLRGGYISSNDESGFSFGVGVTQFGFAFDYAYTPFGLFDKVQRFTARFALDDIFSN